MNFWQWYFSIPRRVFRKKVITHPFLVYMVGGLILIAGSLILGFQYSLLWLILTIPIGLTMACYGLWRQEKED